MTIIGSIGCPGEPDVAWSNSPVSRGNRELRAHAINNAAQHKGTQWYGYASVNTLGRNNLRHLQYVPPNEACSQVLLLYNRGFPTTQCVSPMASGLFLEEPCLFNRGIKAQRSYHVNTPSPLGWAVRALQRSRSRRYNGTASTQNGTLCVVGGTPSPLRRHARRGRGTGSGHENPAVKSIK